MLYAAALCRATDDTIDVRKCNVVPDNHYSIQRVYTWLDMRMARAFTASNGTRFARRGPLHTACALAALLLTGCHPLATMPRMESETPPHWRSIEPAERISARVPDLDGWWRAFNDMKLDALVTQALNDSLTVAVARERLVAARALAAASHAEFLPNIHAGSLSAPDPDATASYLQSNIDAQWELGLFGRIQSTQWIGQSGVDSAAATLQAERVTLVAEVVRDYLELRGAQQQVRLLEQIAHTQHNRRALVLRRRALGLAADSEVARAQADVAQADAALAEPRLHADISAQQLALLCGRAEPPPDLLESAPPPLLVADLPLTVPADLVRTRPDIRRAESAVLAAAGELGVAKADLYPRLSLLGGISTSTTTSGGTLGFGRVVPSVGPVIDIPLFDWGERRARVTAKDAELSAAVYGYRETVLEAVAEAESAFATWHAQRARTVSLRMAVAARARDAQTTASGHGLGLADGVDEAIVSIALEQSRLDLLEAEQAQALAYVALYKALGGGPPIAEAKP